MHPMLMQAIADQRARDMRAQATVARQARRHRPHHALRAAGVVRLRRAGGQASRSSAPAASGRPPVRLRSMAGPGGSQRVSGR
jgi:hypothetical protein